MPEVVTLGETMVLFIPRTVGALRQAAQFDRSIGGAESNVAIGLARLGHTSGWISRLGDDEFGHYIISVIRGEGVDTSRVIWDSENPTAVFFRERREEGPIRVFYYRHGSAASRLSPDDIDPDYIAGAKVLHVTGITLAISASCREAVFRAISIARKAGVAVSFDPNIRLKLWDRDTARDTILRLLSRVDIFLPGLEEAEILVGPGKAEDLARKFVELGAGLVVLKLGPDGCLVASEGYLQHVPGFSVKRVVDPVGAGDGFAAGFLAGWLRGWEPVACGRLANACGALATQVIGDIEGLPTQEEVDAFMKGYEDVVR